MSANRDEFFSRSTARAQFWDDHSQILAGQDLVGGGTWLGITRNGRFAVITNVREPNVVVDNPKTRGDLTRLFLMGDQSSEDYLQSVEAEQERYSGFNLLVGEFNDDRKELFYLSNRKAGIQQLSAGVYGLSNHLLDSSWPKVDAGKAHLKATLSAQPRIEEHHYKLREFLESPALANDDILPKTGVAYEREKALSAAFITLPTYGTRTSTVLTIQNDNILFSEKNYLDENHQQADVDDYQEFCLNTASNTYKEAAL